MKNSEQTHLHILTEFFDIFFNDSKDGFWFAQVDRPVPIKISIRRQKELLLKHAYLADCNQSFIKMYGYSRKEEMLGARFPQLILRSDSITMFNIEKFVKQGYKISNAETHELDKHGRSKHFLNDVIGVVEDEHLVRVWGIQKDITRSKLEESNKKRLLDLLTGEQRRILHLTSQGLSLKEIGGELGISSKTVATIRTRIMRKAGVANVAQLMQWAYQLGFSLKK